LIVCTVTLPPGVNPIAVDKYIYLFKSAGASVQSTTGSRGVSISGIDAGYTMFRGNVKSTGYPLHSPLSPSLPFPWVTVCHHITTGLYQTPSQTP